jgi:flagellar basal body-associated protein FliL
MKVNLRRTAENPNPMGAFEVIVQVDSKDTAIELRDREVELNDHLQRVFEEETFSDLETEIGKARLKTSLKRELNQKLTQGWVKDISFKTFVLKP